MGDWKNPNITPPEETTPEEAERNKRAMGKTEAARQSQSERDAPEATPPDRADKPTG